MTNTGGIATSDTGAGFGALYLNGTASTVINSGSISNSGTGGSGVRFMEAGASLSNSGVISIAPGAANGAHSAVLMVQGGSIVNSGTISGGFNAVYAQSAAGTLTNSGNIFSNDTGAFGVWFTAGGKITNSGTISGAVNAIGITTQPGSVINTGTIIGLGGNAASLSGSGTVTNSGIMTGVGTGVSVTVNSTNAGAVINNEGGVITATATGLITTTVGVFSASNGAFTVTNFGTITGTLASISISGTGAKRVILGEGFKLNGAVTVVSGTTLEWAKGNGTLSSLAALSANFTSIENDAGATLNNASTTAIAANLTNRGTLAPSTTLNLTGNFVQTSTGTFQPAAGSSSLKASGTATLAGAVAVIMPAAPVISTKYAIVTSTGALSGTFSSATSSLMLVTPSLSYDANNAYVTLNQASLQMTGQTRNQAATAAALDKAFANNLSGYSAFLSAFDAGITTPEQLGGALDAISGESNASMSSLAVMQGWNLIDLFQQHSQSTMANEAPDDPWISGFAQSGSFSPLGFNAVHESMAGGVIGADHVFCPGLRGGVMVGMGSQRANIGPASQAKTTFEEIAVTADYVDGKLFANGLIGFSFAQGTTMRAIAVPGVTATAIGKPKTDQILLSGEIGYAEPLDETFSMAPFAQLDFVNANTGAYAETGAGVLNLSFASSPTAAPPRIFPVGKTAFISGAPAAP